MQFNSFTTESKSKCTHAPRTQKHTQIHAQCELIWGGGGRRVDKMFTYTTIFLLLLEYSYKFHSYLRCCAGGCGGFTHTHLVVLVLCVQLMRVHLLVVHQQHDLLGALVLIASALHLMFVPVFALAEGRTVRCPAAQRTLGHRFAIAVGALCMRIIDKLFSFFLTIGLPTQNLPSSSAAYPCPVSGRCHSDPQCPRARAPPAGRRRAPAAAFRSVAGAFPWRR